MLNTHFANMQGTDLMKLSEDERDLLVQSGMEWPVDENGELVESSELEILWDEVRATFNYEMEADQDKAKDDEKRLEGLLKVLELRTADPTVEQSLMLAGKKLDLGELFGSIIQLTTDNEKILIDMTSEEMQELETGAMAEAQAGEQTEQADPETAQEQVNIQAIMQEHGVPENVAMAMREAEQLGTDDEGIEILKQMLLQDTGAVNG